MGSGRIIYVQICRMLSLRVTDRYTWFDKGEVLNAAAKEGQQSRKALMTQTVLLGTHSR